MNVSQILEGIVAKNTQYFDEAIKNDNIDPSEAISWMNDNIINEFNEPNYYNDVKGLVKKLKTDQNFRQKFVQDVKENNLFVEAPCFKEINTKNIYKNSKVNINEEVKIKRETILYLKQKLKLDLNFPTQDVHIKNIFCAPIYTMRLYKIASEIISARDLGACKLVTKQPLKGRSHGGSSRLGQMEIEGIISHGAENCLKELMTVKSDHENEKYNLINQVIRDGSYELPEHLVSEGGTKKVVNTLIQFLQD